jgi:hypothetical protein
MIARDLDETIEKILVDRGHVALSGPVEREQLRPHDE